MVKTNGRVMSLLTGAFDGELKPIHIIAVVNREELLWISPQGDHLPPLLGRHDLAIQVIGRRKAIIRLKAIRPVG
ncbi:hypothetical protein NIES3806_40530 [Microcystis aeruginosa NIES-3806]|nr:hypothetical protein NIES3806_40530 [Microcystis aeruginosa NIES-3806]